MSKPTWKDTTSYSRSDTDRTPCEWTLSVGLLKIVVHHYMHYPPDMWFVTCPKVGLERQRLVAKDIDKAKREALLLVGDDLRATLASLPPEES
jgi:hypothetical protein